MPIPKKFRPFTALTPIANVAAGARFQRMAAFRRGCAVRLLLVALVFLATVSHVAGYPAAAEPATQTAVEVTDPFDIIVSEGTVTAQITVADAQLAPVQLERVEVFAPGLTVTENDLPENQNYGSDIMFFRGVVTSETGGMVALSVVRDPSATDPAEGVQASGTMVVGGAWYTLKSSAPVTGSSLSLSATATELQGPLFEDLVIAPQQPADTSSTPNDSANLASSGGGVSIMGTPTQKAVPVIIEVANSYAVRHGQAAMNDVMSAFNAAAGYYAAQLNLKLVLSGINIWTISEDPYAGSPDAYTLWGKFASRWSPLEKAFSYAAAVLIHEQEPPAGGVVGVALVGAVCQGSNKYAVAYGRSDLAAVNFAHELGHLVGAEHDGQYSQGTCVPSSIMCSAAQAGADTFTATPRATIASTIASKSSCIRDYGAAVSIPYPPSSVRVDPGQYATFSSLADGSCIVYQWQRFANGVFNDIPGKNDSFYQVGPVTSADNGQQFRLKVTNFMNNPVYSAPVSILVNSPIAITQHPAGVVVMEGGTAKFSVQAAGPNLSYAWEENAGYGWTRLPVAQPLLTLTNVQYVSNGRQYRAVVRSGAYEVYSAPALLTVKVYPPVIKVQPKSTTVKQLKSATFSVAASGTALSYQWQTAPKVGAFENVVGGNSAVLVTAPLKLTDNGRRYRVIVANPGGFVVSLERTVTVVR